MAKQYRTKLKSIYGGRSAAGRNEYKPDDILKGQTPKQHCEALIAQRGEGRFEKVSEHEDVCYLLGGNYFGTSVGAEYSYYYDVCTEIAFTGTLNDKATNIKELANLKGGERVIITANQKVTWTATNEKTLIKVAKSDTIYSFTAPKSGTFTITAKGVCDPKASKSVSVKVVQSLPKLTLSEQDVIDIIKVTSTEVVVNLPDDQFAKQTAGVVDTILNRAFLAKGDVRKVINAPNQFSEISGNAGAYGSVQKMPDKDIKPKVQAQVLAHLKDRANGMSSIVGGHVNYLNPVKSGKVPLEQWGNAVVEQAKKEGLVFGVGQNTHYHGTAKGAKQAPKFQLVIPAKYR